MVTSAFAAVPGSVILENYMTGAVPYFDKNLKRYDNQFEYTGVFTAIRMCYALMTACMSYGGAHLIEDGISSLLH